MRKRWDGQRQLGTKHGPILGQATFDNGLQIPVYNSDDDLSAKTSWRFASSGTKMGP
ncbi:MAG: hypothetical protein AAF989_10375 [Planctomycetota bacterium]